MNLESSSRFPLQVTINALFITLSIFLGALLSIQNYNKTSDILLTSAHQVYDQLTDELILDIKGTYTPLLGVLRMIAISPVTSATSLEQRLDYLQAFSIALENNPAAANLQIAYANGDYFIVRHLRDKELMLTFKAPASAVFMADNIETNKMGRRELKRVFFNKQLDIIAREPATDTEYDPRLRTWYIQASTEPVATKPYLFYFSRVVGITAKIKANQPGVVIATDITLENLTDTINKYQITPSSEAVLINAEGQTFAYKDPERIIIKSDDDQLKLADLNQLGSNVLSHLSNEIKANQPGVVIATDITLENLADTINKYQITPNSEAALINAEGQTFAYKDPERIIIKSDDDQLKLADLNQLGSNVLTHLSNDIKTVEQDFNFTFDGKQWTGRTRVVAKPGGVDLFALIVSPVDELLSDAADIRTQSFLVTIAIVLLFIPLIWYISKQVSSSIFKLSNTASSISQFDFDTPINTDSHIREVHELSVAMELMQSTINRFVKLINSLAGEQNLDALLHSISKETMLISNADGVLTYLMNEKENALDAGILCSSDNEYIETAQLLPISMTEIDSPPGLLSKKRSSVISIDSSSKDAFKPLLELFETDHLTMIALPLTNRNFEHIGLLCLLFKHADDLTTESEKASLSFIQALSGFAAVTLEGRQLLHMQEALLNSFIKLIAGAIDAKSPYTGGHCQRVPEITRMLAQAACESTDEPFEDFNLTEKEWEALEIASWLHDCGKVTTPEYVVDKATKLETIYDRIHEVRMRFEVLKRDAEIDYWQQLAAGGDKSTLEKTLNTTLRQLDDDFVFIAECNEGGEFMSDDRIERLKQIAQRTWKRTLDDSIGISWEEARRKSRSAKPALPVDEQLLSDKPEHVIEREAHEHMPENNPWGFKLDVPEYKYNRGELYNLSVARGTLSAEERYKINDHMTQTIMMLEKLPYPKHLRDVPKIAGGHHETMDGKGYPRRLSRDDMSLTARMMAIADIFEALTASDRPYKKPKSLSEAIRIMSFMRNDNHIDPDLYNLFLTSGIYKKYGERFLEPDQLVEVDINEYLLQE